MIKFIKDYVKTNPRLYDFIIRFTPGTGDQSETFFDRFSRMNNRNIRFIQIGANDGLRWDPIRKFVIRDKWKGVFVEPIPFSFEMLKHNYQYVNNSDFVFVNAAICASNSDDLIFWTFSDDFLNTLSIEDKLYYLRLASFDKEHVEKHSKINITDEYLKPINVPCISINDLVKQYWTSNNIDLLIIDAEGHEASIIPSIDFAVLRPSAIFFESHNLGSNKALVFGFLEDNGYTLMNLGGDTVAFL